MERGQNLSQLRLSKIHPSGVFDTRIKQYIVHRFPFMKLLSYLTGVARKATRAALTFVSI